VKSDGLEVKAGRQVDGSHDVLESRHDARGHLTVLGIGSGCRSRNTVRVVGNLLSVLLRRGDQVVRAIGVRERTRSDELRANVRTAWRKTQTSRKLTVCAWAAVDGWEVRLFGSMMYYIVEW
jgi:hypothetical protein